MSREGETAEGKKEGDQDDLITFAYRDSQPAKSPRLSARKVKTNYLESINKRYGSSEKREKRNHVTKTSPRTRVITDSQMTFGDDQNILDKPRL